MNIFLILLILVVIMIFIFKKNNDDVTVVVTACNRPHLLKRTMDSFMNYNTYPIKKYIVIEDSGNQGINDFLKTDYPDKNWELIYNETNKGQIESIDIAYSKVNTKYIFHCEEDWEFKKHGFIEESMRILNTDSKIFTVWLRPHNHTNGHPIEYGTNRDNYFLMSNNFTYTWNNMEHKWCGVTLNPGLRRTRDVMIFHPYCENIDKHPILGVVDEYMISTRYDELGFRGAITSDVNGYLDHIGGNEHVPRIYEK